MEVMFMVKDVTRMEWELELEERWRCDEVDCECQGLTN